MGKIIDWIYKKMTHNHHKIGIFAVYLDAEKVEKNGWEGSRTLWTHPNIAQDVIIQKKVKELSDYIADNFDLTDFTRL